MDQSILSTGIRRCRDCGADNGLRAKFCSECGKAMPQRADGGIVRELAERKFLTILFADIRNSTDMIQALDPEDAMAKLRPVIDLMAAAVREAGGMVNRIQGDGIMALFGAPVAVDDHALRACRAALLMRDRVAELTDRDITIRIGVHSGEVVAHIAAGDFAHAYDVTGQAAHLAARLEQAAEAGTALISDDTRKLAGHAVEARPRPGLVFKGFERGVDAWELVGLGQRSRWLARQASGLSPFVSRAAELADLRGRLGLARRGPCQILTIGGEPGTGKSRLVHELVCREAPGAWMVWEADAEPTTSRAPFAIVRQFLRRWLGVDEASTPEGVAEALQVRLKTVEVPATGSAALAALLNLQVEDATWAEMDLPGRARLIEATLAAILEAAQRDCPVLLLVEDLHWADAESRALLLALPARLPDARVAVIATHRPMEGLPERGNHVLPVTLAEFSPQAAERFLDKLLGSEPSVQGIKRQLLDSTGRLPFFLEETVRHLLETGALSGTPGACVATVADLRVATPRSAQGVASARVDALEPGLKKLVRHASALGKRFPRALLADIASSEPAAFTAAVRDLAQRHIFFDNADGAEDFIEFRHEFIREAAYGALMRDHRQALHRAILQAIESRYADGLRDWTATLAHHAARAQLWEKAVDYEEQSADQAIAASSYPSALAACQRALEYLERLPRTKETNGRRIDVRLMLRAALAPTSNFSDWLRFAEEAVALATENNDQERMLAASIHRAWALNFAGEPKDAIPIARLAVNAALRANDIGSHGVASFVLGQACYAGGEYIDALPALDGAARWFSGDHEFDRAGGSATTSVSCHMMRAMCLASMGRFEESERASAKAEGLATRTRRPYDIALSRYGRGVASLLQGKALTAVELLEDGRNICLSSNIPTFQLLVEAQLGAAYLGAGRRVDAAAMIDRALAAAEVMNHMVARAAAGVFRAALDIIEQGPERAMGRLRAEHSNARRRGFKGIEIAASRFMALATLKSSPPQIENAIALLSEAMSKASACGAVPQHARCLVLLAEAERQAGRNLEAQAFAASALNLFRRMGLESEADHAAALVEDCRAHVAIKL